MRSAFKQVLGSGTLALILFSAEVAHAASPSTMMAQCRGRAASSFRLRLPDVDTKYEGQRVDGTHAVNGTAYPLGRTVTFQCSFDRPGQRILRFVVNR
ncbi:hypothetical protein [Bradyrhizobium sp. SRS-191]|uniref:hypothetical protein n=1 Tax=Bradyrhizobium sp. SRS-191 TaxID=2962606 RepID=UPI00211EB6F3|nr:hypothetical protein [Bradyrhizobium sp. SRS-191]